MNQPDVQIDNRTYPSAIVLVPTLIGMVVWLWALLGRLPQY
jgi:hypothetical protein